MNYLFLLFAAVVDGVEKRQLSAMTGEVLAWAYKQNSQRKKLW